MRHALQRRKIFVKDSDVLPKKLLVFTLPLKEHARLHDGSVRNERTHTYIPYA
jgi:hypothetical protein